MLRATSRRTNRCHGTLAELSPLQATPLQLQAAREAEAVEVAEKSRAEVEERRAAEQAAAAEKARIANNQCELG